MFLEAMEDIWDPLAPKIPSVAKGMRILLVDRDTTSLMFMASILEAYSYKVTTMEIFSIAMAIYEERRDEFDMIMANVQLHNMTDLEFVQEMIKKKNTPIVLMSTAGARALWKQEKLDGASHCYEKPLSSSQLRDVWQHVYRNRISKGGIETRQLGTADGNEFRPARDDPDGKKNKQVVVDDAPVAETEPLRKMAADQNQRSGDRKRSSNHDDDDDDDDDKGGKRKCQRRINTDRHSPSLRRRSQRKQGLRWSKELQFKFTAAISKLGEEKANPKTIQEVMNVPNLSQRQIALQLEKYKAQVQLIMDTCKDTPPWALTSIASGALGLQQLQKQHETISQSRHLSTANVTGTAGVPPWRRLPPPPVSRQPAGSLNLATPVSLHQPGHFDLRNNPGENRIIRPGYLVPNYSGHGGQHQGLVQIRERERLPLSTPFTTNSMGKGKQVLGFLGNTITTPYVPDLLQYRPNPTPAPTLTRLSDDQEEQYSIVNLPAACASANPDVPADPPTGNGAGDDESDDLAFLTDWLKRSLKPDDTGVPTFDWLDTDMP